MRNNDQLQEVLDLLDIEAWLEREGVSFTSARGSSGRQLNVKECPCCGNSNWKVYLNAESGLGNCFVCDQKFNKWSFIKHSLGTFTTRQVIDNIKEAAQEQGWKPPRQALAVNLETELVLPDSLPLPIKGRNLKYLENRNISIELAKYFSLRFSHKGRFFYTDDNGSQKSQNYANRIIIPVFDLAGDLVSFQGRDITGTAERKYLFPPGFASTGSVIYNGHNAHGARHIVIGEGVFDVIAIKAALDSNLATRDVVAVGSFGKHLSHGDDHSQLARLLDLKSEGLQVITVMWDGEKAALEAAVSTADLLRRYGFESRVALLPKDRDPNEVPSNVVLDAFWKAQRIDTMSATKLLLSRIYG